VLRRTAQAVWMGDLRTGRGMVEFGGGAFQGNYSFASRFAGGEGTNPEELIAAAHAGCFAMALSNMLAESGHVPETVEVQATITLEKLEEGFRITKSHLECTAKVPGISEGEFQGIARKAKESCPVSVLLSSIPISLTARLRA